MKNITDYGAVGDGVTDDGPAIQAAINACGEREALRVPDEGGGCWVSSTIDTGGKPITLRGDGQSRAANVYTGGSFIFGNFAGPIFRSLYPAQGGTIVDIGFCNRATDGAALELSGGCVTVDRVATHAFYGIRMMPSTFSAALRSVNVRCSGNPVGSVGITVQGHCAVHAADVVGFDNGIRASGLGVDIRSCRVEVNRTGILLGVNYLGQTVQITGGLIEAISLEANDIGIESRAAALTSLRGIAIQGTPNAPAGASQYGLLINNGQGLEVASSIANGAYAVSAIRIAATSTFQRWSNVLTGNSTPTGKRWDIAAMKNLSFEQCD
jgi:hypothetical protein